MLDPEVGDLQAGQALDGKEEDLEDYNDQPDTGFDPVTVV